MARQEINWNEVEHEDFWLYEQLDELDRELEASGVEDATAWEGWGDMERVLGLIAERKAWRKSYPREQYEADKARMIAEGENPRCIMSYYECMMWDLSHADDEREQEIWDSYDEAMAEMETPYDEVADEPTEFDCYGATERDRLIELVEEVEVASLAELKAFGCIEFEPQFNWSSKSTPEDRGWLRAVLDIIEFEGEEDAEALFELF